MKILTLIFSLICITAEMTSSAQFRGWRGLVPLHSSRADVVRLLGPPTERLHEYWDFYRTSNETILITYATGSPCGIGEKYSQWRVPRDTVESIVVTPTRPVSLYDLAIDQTKYKKQSGGHRPEDIYYVNDEAGETIRVFMENVMDMIFNPGRADEHLSCSPLPPPSPQCEGLDPYMLHSYVSLRPEQEQLLLDNFAITLLRSPNAVGYIIAFGGKRTRAGEARELTDRAKSHLIKVRSFPPDRLTAIDGGYREERQVELYVVPSKLCPPVPAPTVDPRDVRIIKGGKARKNRSSRARELRHTH